MAGWLGKGGLAAWVGGWAGMGRLVGTFIQPERVYVCGVIRTRSETRIIEKLEKLGEGGSEKEHMTWRRKIKKKIYNH